MIIENIHLGMAKKYNVLQAVLKRFLKGFVAGAIAAMLLIVPASTASWADVATWLNALSLAGIFGGLNGLLLAVQKWSQSWVK